MKRTGLALAGGLLLFAANLFAADGDLIVNGNAGLGTSSPGARLQVGNFLKVFDNNGNASDMNYIRGFGNHLVVQGNGDLYLNYPENNAGMTRIGETFFVQRQGNVGIGTAGPGRKLEVAFSNTDDGGGIGLQNSATGGRLWGLTVAATGDVNSVPAGSLYLRDDSVGGAKLVVNTSGNVRIGTTNPGTYRLYVDGPAYSTGGWETSDINFKENIAPIDSPLIKVLKMEGVSFNWRTGKDKMGNFLEGRRFGVIAQNIEGILPEAVKDGPDGKKAVAYTQIIPVLIEAIKEQQKQIEALKSEVAGLKARQ